MAGAGTPYAVIETIKKALLELSRGQDGQKILRRLDEDFRNGFSETSDMDYADIRSKINAVPQTCGSGCHPKIKL